MRPFQKAAEVHCRGYSRPLQRMITDFGSDVAFGKIPQKMMEHHGVSIPISAGQTITEIHAQHILEAQNWETEIPAIEGVEFLIAEMDGTMVPIVETTPSEIDGIKVDRRKTRQISWKEARLTSARKPEQKQPIFGGTIGSVDDAGAAFLIALSVLGWEKKRLYMGLETVRLGLLAKSIIGLANLVAIY